MDIVAIYDLQGDGRVVRHDAQDGEARGRSYDARGAGRPAAVCGEGAGDRGVVDLVAQRVRATDGRITAKRLLVEARVAGHAGTARGFRRAVSAAAASSLAI